MSYQPPIEMTQIFVIARPQAEAIQGGLGCPWIAASASPPRNDESVDRAVGITLVAEDRASEVVTLFADNGAVFSSLPRYLIGKAAIAAQYANVHNKGAIPVGYLESTRECAVTIAAVLNPKETGGARAYGIIAMNHFKLDARGKIERLIIYVRPDAIARMPR